MRTGGACRSATDLDGGRVRHRDRPARRLALQPRALEHQVKEYAAAGAMWLASPSGPTSAWARSRAGCSSRTTAGSRCSTPSCATTTDASRRRSGRGLGEDPDRGARGEAVGVRVPPRHGASAGGIALARQRMRCSAPRKAASQVARGVLDGLALGPGARSLHQRDAPGVVADQPVERVVPLVVRDELPALLLPHAGEGTDRRGEPCRAGGGVLLHLDVGAGEPERRRRQRREADVELALDADKLVDGHQAVVHVAVVVEAQVRPDRHDADPVVGAQQPLQHARAIPSLARGRLRARRRRSVRSPRPDGDGAAPRRPRAKHGSRSPARARRPARGSAARGGRWASSSGSPPAPSRRSAQSCA